MFIFHVYLFSLRHAAKEEFRQCVLVRLMNTHNSKWHGENSNHFLIISSPTLLTPALIHPGSHPWATWDEAWFAVGTTGVFTFYKWSSDGFCRGWNKEHWTHNDQRTLINVHRPSVVWTTRITETNIHRQVFTRQVKKTRVSDRSLIQRRACDLMECSVTGGQNRPQRQPVNCTYRFWDRRRAEVGNWMIFFFFAPPPDQGPSRETITLWP